MTDPQNNSRDLDDLILSTLSFYEAMSFSKIVFDIDTNILKGYPNFDKDQMLLILNSLEKRGLVKRMGQGSETEWMRIHKRKSFWKKIQSFFR